MQQRRHHRSRRLGFELVEPRLCLSTVAFASHNIDCCAVYGQVLASAVDLDGDGDVDVLYGASGNQHIAWYENTDGRGHFSQQKIIADVFYPSLTPADLDGDGDIDVLVAGGSELTWFENDGHAKFIQQPETSNDNLSIPSTGMMRHTDVDLLVADVDGDGDLDAIAAFASISFYGIEGGVTAWYENSDGQGTFTAPRLIARHGVTSVAAADADHDGDVDIFSVSGDRVAHVIAWHENIGGNEVFAPAEVIHTGDGSFGSITAADVNGDDNPDALVSYRWPGNIAWLENMGERGRYELRQVIGGSGNEKSSFVAGDVDGDGDLDVASADSLGEEIVWHDNTDGKGHFADGQMIATDAEQVDSIALADLNGDGQLDVLMAGYNGVLWCENADGNGNFGSPQSISGPHLGILETGDIDGDGDLDVLAWLYDGELVWYENTDSRGRSWQRNAMSIAVHRFQTLVDVDGDDDLDLFSAYTDTLAWYENTDGGGAFGPEQEIMTMDRYLLNPIWIIADLDSDDDADLIAISHTHRFPELEFDVEIIWWENTAGLGSLGTPQVIEREGFVVGGAGREAVGLSVADLDADGDLDVIAALDVGRPESRIVWYENRGDVESRFGPQQVIMVASGDVDPIELADLDGDGDKDLLAVLSAWPVSGSTVVWLENIDGRGAFGSPEEIIVPTSIVPQLSAADIDGDSDVDLLLIDHCTATTWYENIDGTAEFRAQPTIASSFSNVCRSSAPPADLDGDGDLDVFGSFAQEGRLDWYEQRLVGDANDDGVFNSSDLVQIFQAGEYEDHIPGNSTYEEGDWNGDSEFDSSDLVLAFQAGVYERPPAQGEIAAAVEWLFAQQHVGTRPRAFVV